MSRPCDSTPTTIYGGPRRYDPDNLFHLNQNIQPGPVPSPRDSTA